MGDFVLHGGEIEERIEPAEGRRGRFPASDGRCFPSTASDAVRTRWAAVLANAQELGRGEAKRAEALEGPGGQQRR